MKRRVTAADITGEIKRRETEAVEPAITKQETAKRAIEILCSIDRRFRVPTARERQNLIVEFARSGRVVYGKAFDVVRIEEGVDLRDAAAVAEHLDVIKLYEVKATNKASVRAGFSGFFFALTTAELLVAQSLRDQYGFAFVNVRTREHRECSLREVFASARNIYPTWSIQF